MPLTRLTPVSALSSAKKSTNHHHHLQQQPPPPRAQEPADERVQLLRLRYRNYQRNHRAKRQQKQESLQDAISALQRDNSTLEARKRELLHGIARSFVREYFQVFASDDGSSRGPDAKIAVQQQFLRSKLHEHVEGQDLNDVAQFQDQAALYAYLFRSSSVALQSMRIQFTSDDLMVIVMTSVIITLEAKQGTWLFLCPHIAAASSGIQQRLGSNPLQVPGRITFVLHSDGLVHKLYREFDFCAVFQQALGSIELAASLIDGANMSFTTGTIAVERAELGQLDGAHHSGEENNDDAKSDAKLDIAFLLT